MNKPTADEITKILDTIYIAVDESTFGPVFHHPNAGNPMEKQMNQVCFGIISILIPSIIKNITFATASKGGDNGEKSGLAEIQKGQVS